MLALKLYTIQKNHHGVFITHRENTKLVTKIFPYGKIIYKDLSGLEKGSSQSVAFCTFIFILFSLSFSGMKRKREKTLTFSCNR